MWKTLISIILMNLYGCKSTKLYKIQGQEANMIFPYPCDSTEVTLQHSHRAPFYRSTVGLSLALPEDQVHRFKVQNRIENRNCSLDLTITNLMKSDEGTYLSTIYKEGLLLDDYTTRVGLQVDYPPGTAACVVSEEKGGDWVSTDPIETATLLTQTILIRNSQPVFCCSSALIEYKERCECDDTSLYKADDDSNDPCPSLSEITTMPPLSTLTENNQSDYYSTMTSSIPINTKKCNSNQCVPVVIHSIAVPIEVILLILSLFFHYKIKTKIRNNENCKDSPILPQLHTLLNGHKIKNGSRKNTEFA